MKKTPRKLHLHRETLTELTHADVRRAEGAALAGTHESVCSCKTEDTK